MVFYKMQRSDQKSRRRTPKILFFRTEKTAEKNPGANERSGRVPKNTEKEFDRVLQQN